MAASLDRDCAFSRWILPALTGLALAGCGGGGSSGSGGGGGGPADLTIGGTITGLAASGLVLANGGDKLTVSSGATSFTFPTKVASGTSYDVTIATQPTGEQCKVTSASGTATANVTSVAVACSPQTFTISGTITGLNASGLEIQYYSGGETLSVTASAQTFRFSQPVPYGTVVKLTVVSQPYWVWCTPGSSDFSGPIKSNITSDTLSCAPANAHVTTYSGSTTGGGYKLPVGVAVDSVGNVYVADTNHNQIRKISPNKVVTTLAGTGTAGSADGAGNVAQFNGPTGVALDSAGNVYVADAGNNEIRKVTAAGVVSTLAGSTTSGSADGTGAAAQFYQPLGLTVDPLGNIYVADTGNNEIREVTPSGVVTTYAGSLSSGHADGNGTSATFFSPAGVVADSAGDLYVADEGNYEIRKISSSDVVSTLAGSTTPGHADGLNGSASFAGPYGITVDSEGNIYVADYVNNEIRKVTATGKVTTLAGTYTTAGFADGTGSAATFNEPTGVAADASGDIYVADYANNEIRKVAPGP